MWRRTPRGRTARRRFRCPKGKGAARHSLSRAAGAYRKPRRTPELSRSTDRESSSFPWTGPAGPRACTPQLITGFARRSLTHGQVFAPSERECRKKRTQYCKVRLLTRSVQLSNSETCSSLLVRCTRSPGRIPLDLDSRGVLAGPNPPSGRWCPVVGVPRLRPPWAVEPLLAHRRPCADSDKAAKWICHSVTSDPHRVPGSPISAVQRLVLAVSADITCASWCMRDESPLDFSEPER